MIAILWAREIMLGNRQYSDVPRLLRESVKTILAESGKESMAEE